MKTKNARYLLIPLALLAVIILAACTPATATPAANVPMTPGSGMNSGQSGNMNGNGQNMNDNGRSNNDMMDGQTEEDMMDDQSEEGMMDGNGQSIVPGDVQSIAQHMNAALAPMGNLVSMMGDTPEAQQMMTSLEEMQKEMNEMQANPDPQRLGEMMQEASVMAGSLQNMMGAGQFNGDPAAVAGEMQQMMTHLGIMTQMMGGYQNGQMLTQQMDEMQRRYDSMMSNGNFSTQEFDQMMGDFGAMMGEMGVMFGATGSQGSAMVDEGRSQTNLPKNADGFTDISVAQLEKMLQNKDFTLVNVHIPFAGNIPQTDISIPYNEIAQNVDKLPTDKDAPIVLYCRSGAMSTAAAKTLVGLGYANVLELDGGMNALVAAGNSLPQN